MICWVCINHLRALMLGSPISVFSVFFFSVCAVCKWDVCYKFSMYLFLKFPPGSV